MAAQSTAERRRTRRIQIKKPARVTLDDRPLGIGCVISDLTSVGARLKLSCLVALPDAFHVTPIGSPSTFLSSKVWQIGDEVGVRFTDVRLHAAR
jgi:hypothetical protein